MGSAHDGWEEERDEVGTEGETRGYGRSKCQWRGYTRWRWCFGVGRRGVGHGRRRGLVGWRRGVRRVQIHSNGVSGGVRDGWWRGRWRGRRRWRVRIPRNPCPVTTPNKSYLERIFSTPQPRAVEQDCSPRSDRCRQSSPFISSETMNMQGGHHQQWWLDSVYCRHLKSSIQGLWSSESSTAHCALCKRTTSKLSSAITRIQLLGSRSSYTKRRKQNLIKDIESGVEKRYMLLKDGMDFMKRLLAPDHSCYMSAECYISRVSWLSWIRRSMRWPSCSKGAREESLCLKGPPRTSKSSSSLDISMMRIISC